MFFNDPLRDIDSILDQLISLKVKYIFINESYLNNKSYIDYQIINSALKKTIYSWYMKVTTSIYTTLLVKVKEVKVNYISYL